MLGTRSALNRNQQINYRRDPLLRQPVNAACILPKRSVGLMNVRLGKRHSVSLTAPTIAFQKFSQPQFCLRDRIAVESWVILYRSIPFILLSLRRLPASALERLASRQSPHDLPDTDVVDFCNSHPKALPALYPLPHLRRFELLVCPPSSLAVRAYFRVPYISSFLFRKLPTMVRRQSTIGVPEVGCQPDSCFHLRNRTVPYPGS